MSFWDIYLKATWLLISKNLIGLYLEKINAEKKETQVTWAAWCKKNLIFTQRYANNLIRVAKKIDDDLKSGNAFPLPSDTSIRKLIAATASPKKGNDQNRQTKKSGEKDGQKTSVGNGDSPKVDFETAWNIVREHTQDEPEKVKKMIGELEVDALLTVWIESNDPESSLNDLKNHMDRILADWSAEYYDDAKDWLGNIEENFLETIDHHDPNG